MTVSLYAVTHKEVENLPQDRIVIGVGGNRNLSCAKVYDNSGSNIAEKNANYCELTALYWIWKNDNSDFVSLEHYRRFFSCGNIFRAKPLSKEKIAKKLLSCDIILPKKTNLKKPRKIYKNTTVYKRYKTGHVIGDLDECIKVINEKFPEYAEDLNAVLSDSKIFLLNMFVAKKQLADSYCEWLFNILFEVEKSIDLTGRDDYQRRAFGFLSERLFNVWVRHNNLKVCYLPVRDINEKPLKRKIKSALKNLSGKK